MGTTQDEIKNFNNEIENALYEIFKGDIEAAEIKGRDEGRLEGRLEATITSCKRFGATREKTLSMIMDDFNYSAEQAEENLKLYW